MHLRKMCSLLLLDGIFFMSVMSLWSIVLFRFTVSLLIFCPDDLCNVLSEVLKSPAIMVLLSFYYPAPSRPAKFLCVMRHVSLAAF